MTVTFGRSLFSGIVVLTAARVLGALCVFATSLLITRLFGAEVMAQYAVYLAAASILSVLLPIGFHAVGSMLAAEYASRGDHSMVSAYIGYGQRLILIVGLATAIVSFLFFSSWPVSHSYNYGLTLAFAIPSAVAMALIYFNSSVLIGLQRPFAGQLPDICLRPLLVVTVTVLLATKAPGIKTWILLFAATCIFWVTALMLWWSIRRYHVEDPVNSETYRSEKRNWWRIAPSWAAITLFWDYIVEIHVLLASLFFSSFEVALLHICFRIRQLAGFGLKALYSLLMPKVFAANAVKEGPELRKLVRLSSRVAFVYALAAWIGVVTVSPWVLGLFGEAFLQGQFVLMIIMATLPIRAAFGPAPAVLGMKRNQNQIVLILLVSASISAAVILASHNVLGLASVAIGYLAAGTISTVLMWSTAIRKTGINCAAWA